MFESILYLFVLPPGNPFEMTPFQGFSPGLIPMLDLLDVPLSLPGDLTELTMDKQSRISRRRAGFGGWAWSPVTLDSLTNQSGPTALAPFAVLFSADEAVAHGVAAWVGKLPIKPLHVSLAEVDNAINPSELSIERLQQHCQCALQQAKLADPELDVEGSYAELCAWNTSTEERPSSLRLHSHNVTLPNEMVLISAGEAAATGPEGHLNCSAYQDYVDGITESARAVLALQSEIDQNPIYEITPARPDVILFAPATFRGIEQVMRKLTRAQMRVLRSLERQKEYVMKPLEVDSEHDAHEMESVLFLRGAELKIQTIAVGMRAASTLASTLRLPPAINRTTGVVDQFARHLRSYDYRPPDRKTANVFRTVQEALLKSVPADHLEVLRESRAGVKIISNAPLEWLPLDGVPLGVAKDVSRINVTPGNSLIEQLTSRPPLLIPPDHFRNFLIVSMFEDDDPLANHMTPVVEILSRAPDLQIDGQRTTADSVGEFVAALNAYDGPMLIVDSHGTHKDDPGIGGLILRGQSIDIWKLRGKVKVPPIVILSACDTHPFDRSHATVANGFLHCGALAVLATVLPIRSHDAARFILRLIMRAVVFGDAMSSMGKSVSWTTIIGGALRMQLAHDIVIGLTERQMIPAEIAEELQLKANCDINPLNPLWLQNLGERCRKAGGFDEAKWQQSFDDILAASDVIRYVNLGNPESIIVADERVTARLAEEHIQ